MRPTTLFSRRQDGVTLTELMIALVLGALVVLAATAMVVTSRGTYRTQDESTRLSESSRFALELVSRLVRLAGYTNWGVSPNPPPGYVPDPTWALAPDSYALNGPNIVGSDNSKPGGGPGVNGSDSLTIRYFGSNSETSPASPDGNVLDCAGTPVPEPATASSVVTATSADAVNRNARAYNVLFVEADVDGEPALKCQRQTFDAAGTPSGLPGDKQTLIRGVEDFQVLYGEYIPQNIPNDNLDENPPQSIVYRTGIGGANPVSNWERVRSVRIAMLIRSAVGARADAEPTTQVYKLFGSYPGTASDTGTSFALTSLSTAERTRERRVVETTIFVRNRETGWNTLKTP